MLGSLYISILTFCWLIADISATDTDYCSPKLCSIERKHIGCNNTDTFSSDCPKGQTKMVSITTELIKEILHAHNSKRDLIASGNLDGFAPASKMSLMKWDTELAYLAELNVKSCKFRHDNCRNTFNFKQSGQNLAKMWWTGRPYTDKKIIVSRIDTWWLEYKNTNISQMQAYPRYTDKMIGHFTVMTAEKNSFVGCGAIKFPESGMSSLTLACNYAATNLIGMPMYTPGPTASECTLGTSSDYPSLCV